MRSGETRQTRYVPVRPGTVGSDVVQRGLADVVRCVRASLGLVASGWMRRGSAGIYPHQGLVRCLSQRVSHFFIATTAENNGTSNNSGMKHGYACFQCEDADKPHAPRDAHRSRQIRVFSSHPNSGWHLGSR